MKDNSYLINLWIVKNCEPHSSGELLFYQLLKIWLRQFWEQKQLKKQKKYLSKNLVENRTDIISCNMGKKMNSSVSRMHLFSLHLEDSTNVTNNTQLLVFIQIDYHDDIKDFLFYKLLRSNAIPENIF